MKSIYRLTLLDWGNSSYFTKDKRVLYGKNSSSIDKCFGNPWPVSNSFTGKVTEFFLFSWIMHVLFWLVHSQSWEKTQPIACDKCLCKYQMFSLWSLFANLLKLIIKCFILPLMELVNVCENDLVNSKMNLFRPAHVIACT